MGTQGILGIVVILLGIGLVTAQTATAADDRNLPATVIQGNNAFAIDLYSHLKIEAGNLFFCPYSIRTALIMTYAGARGNTAEQMAQVLHLSEDQQQLHQALSTWRDELNQKGTQQQDYQLHSANALWGQKGYHFLDDFLTLTRTYYGAGLQEVDFEKALEEARKTINAWVEDQTHGKIVDFIKPQMIDNTTTLVLTNAIYFKGNWVFPFEKDRTDDAAFTLMNGEQITVPMMSQTATVSYAEDDRVQVLELPYMGDRLSMVFMLPQQPDGLPDLEPELTVKYLEQHLARLQEQKVMVTIPKLSLETDVSLPKMLNALGMTDAFSLPPADFSGMTGKQELSISEVFHKACLDVNEEGAEAAAATEVSMSRGFGLHPTFLADHPFLLLILDRRTGGILFLGRVMDPR